MPLYCYSCEDCKHELEKIESYGAPTIQDCPQCLAKSKLVRRIAVSNFSLSGSGWYRDAYKKTGM